MDNLSAGKAQAPSASDSTPAVTKIDIDGRLKHLATGKVRELFQVDGETLLFVATDRISAFDVVLENGIPGKGPLLTRMTHFWLSYLSARIPELRTHFLSQEVPTEKFSSYDPSKTDDAALVSLLAPRSMQVRRARVLPLESIVRGYITGSAWSEYTSKGTVHGISVPAGLSECARLPSALWTPSTKAEAGAHDENIHPDEATRILERAGFKDPQALAQQVHDLSLQMYDVAAQYAWDKGIVIADTKFEFGLVEEAAASADGEAAPALVLNLVDEVLTPDSSRFWPRDGYAPGRSQNSFDKQPLRDWLAREGLKGKQGVSMTDEVVALTQERYKTAFEMLVGKDADTVLQTV